MYLDFTVGHEGEQYRLSCTLESKKTPAKWDWRGGDPPGEVYLNVHSLERWDDELDTWYSIESPDCETLGQALYQEAVERAL